MDKLFRETLYRRKKEIFIILFLQTLASLTTLIAPYINGRFVDVLVSSQEYRDILLFTAIAFFISFFGIMTGYIFRIIQLKVKSYMSFELNLKIIEHIQRIPIEKFEKFESTYMNQRIRGDCETVTNFWMSNFMSAILNVIILISMSILLIKLNRALFLIIIIFIPIYCFIYILMRKPLYVKGLESTESSNLFVSKLNELYERSREIKTDVLFDLENKAMFNKFSSYMNIVLRYNKLLFGFNSLDGIISLMFQIIVFLYGGKMVIQKDMTIGEFTMINSYFSIILESIKYYFLLGQTYQEMKISRNRIQELLDINLESNGIEVINRVDRLEARKVNYSYNSKNVFNIGFDINIDKKGIYGLIGKNGIGKTTLVNILVGINNDKLSGEVCINGLDTKKIDMYNLRKFKISLMMQGTNNTNIIVSDYIYKYITKDKFDLLREDDICNKVFFSDLFNLDFLMTKKISELSSGERQMVQLFTKVYKIADVYIFDEPTSNVHPLLIDNIWLLMEQLKNLEKIIIIISHDKCIYNKFDKCFDLNIQ